MEPTQHVHTEPCMQPNDSVISRIRLIGNFGHATKLNTIACVFAIEGKAGKPMTNVAKACIKGDTIFKTITVIMTLRSRGRGGPDVMMLI